MNDLIPAKALPLDEQSSLGDDDYEMPDDYQQAISYLRGVRDEQNQTPQLYLSKFLLQQQQQHQNQTEESKRDYLDVSLSRIIFQPSIPSQNNIIANDNLYQDSDIVLSRDAIPKIQPSLWPLQWVELVKGERVKNRNRLLAIKVEKIKDAYDYYEQVMAIGFKAQKISDNDIAKASEIVLQDIFGIVATERETKWDKKKQIPEIELAWIYGLLCLLEKPLLAEQAGDLNQILNIMLKQRQSFLDDQKQLAPLDVNIVIITEYFEQRFK